MDEIIKKAESDIDKILKENNLEISYDLDLSDEVEMAIRILNKHGMKIKILLKPKKETPQIP